MGDLQKKSIIFRIFYSDHILLDFDYTNPKKGFLTNRCKKLWRNSKYIIKKSHKMWKMRRIIRKKILVCLLFTDSGFRWILKIRCRDQRLLRVLWIILARLGIVDVCATLWWNRQFSAPPEPREQANKSALVTMWCSLADDGTADDVTKVIILFQYQDPTLSL